MAAKPITVAVVIKLEPEGSNPMDIDPKEVAIVLSDEIDGMGGVWATDDDHDNEQQYTLSVLSADVMP